MALLTLTDVAKTFDANRPLLTAISLVVGDEDRIGLIGPNGAGKSTLLKILAGLETPDAGERVMRRGVRIGYLEQEPGFAPERSVREIVRGGIEGREALLAEIDALHGTLADPDLGPTELKRLLRRQERLQEQLDERGGHDVEHRVEEAISGVGLPDPEALCGRLSGGEARRVALARLLIGTPDLLLLDEPTNHLDTFVVAWLEEQLARWKTPLVLVTHDRYLLDRVVNRIVEIDLGTARAYEGGYDRFVVQRAERLETEKRHERSRLNLLRRETAWMRRGPLARTSKSKARIARYEKLAGDVPALRLEDLEMAFPPGPRLGAKVVELCGVEHSFGERCVVPRLDLEITSEMRLGIVGPNGAGKTTLLRILLGRLEATGGRVKCGETVRFATIDQKRSELDPARTVCEEVAGKADHVHVGDRDIHVASFLDRFLFPGAKKDVRVGDLSGGERGRVLLAKLLLTGANVLVLDEPTNDLDLTTLRALEEAVDAFRGAVVVVSHDRWFLDRVSTHILYLDGAGGARLHTGGVSSLLEHLAAEKTEAEASTPRAATEPNSPRRREKSKASGPKPLSPWEKRELDELTERVATLEDALGAIDEKLADPHLYTENHAEARRLQQKRLAVGREHDEAMARWEQLAERDL